MRVTLYTCPGSGRRAIYLAEALRNGFKKHGIKCETLTRFNGVKGDIAIGYGWSHRPVFEAYKDAGRKFAYFDLGYWNRRPATLPLDGHYRLAINDWDTLTNMKRGMPDDRFKRLNVEVKSRVSGGKDILIAAMSQKAVKVHGYEFHQWEDEVISQLKSFDLNFPIVLREKPNKKVTRMPPIEEVLQRAHMLITHHSNAAVDAIVGGVPVWAKKGVGRIVSQHELSKDTVEQPMFPSEKDRMSFLHDVAYAQWTPDEMRSGDAWEFMKDALCA